jgi:ADP-ribosylglycohydrolase
VTAEWSAQTARGIFLGAAVGDALGWPQEIRGGLIGGQKQRDRLTPSAEFRSWTRTAGHYSRKYKDPVGPGEYSDDTQLLLATARSCLAGDLWWQRLTEIELAAWPLYQRGGGGAVLSAAGSWADGRPPWRVDGPARAQAVRDRYRRAGANGVAMRVAPHVLWADGPDDLIRRVVRDGIATHGHPRALVGALVYAFALGHAASSQGTHGFGDSVDAAAAGLIDVERVLAVLPPDWGSPQDIDVFAVSWRDTNKETSQLLSLVAESLQRGAMSNPESTLELLGCTDPKVNGAGTVCAAAAIYVASRFAARPQGGLLSAAFLRKADTDTLASLTAAILGALHETEWLGTLAITVQDSDYISTLADRSAARVVQPQPQPTRRPSVLRKTLREELLARRGTEGEFPDGRHYLVKDTVAVDERDVLRTWLRLDEGQTVIVDLRADLAVSTDPRAARGHDPSVLSSPLDRSKREPEVASSRARAVSSAEPDSLGTSPRPTSPESRVILTASSLARSAAFYARVTGRDISVRGGTAEITPELLLQQSASDRRNEVSAIVHIVVDSVAAARRRLGAVTDTGAHLDVRDPDGRTVRISERLPGVPKQNSEGTRSAVGPDQRADPPRLIGAYEAGMSAWLPSTEVFDKSGAIYRDDLRSLDIEPLTNWLSDALGHPRGVGEPNTNSAEARELRDVYADALFDLSRLAEELRFETSVGAVYLIGVRDDIAASKHPAGAAAGGMSIPTVVHALLSPYMLPNPDPSQLIINPGQPIAGQRVLGGWWAAQLFDSALIRGLACLDRLAILLHCAAGKSLSHDRLTKERRLPAFRTTYLKPLEDAYDREQWAQLMALLDHEVFKFVKRYRDGFVHQRRGSMELHGEFGDPRDNASDRMEVLSPGQHLAMVIAFYKLVLTPACAIAGELIASSLRLDEDTERRPGQEP